MRLVQKCTLSQVCVGEGFSQEIDVKVRVHQGSLLSLLLFIIVLEALSREFQAGVPWEDPYVDYLVIIADSLDECAKRLLICRRGSGSMQERQRS